MPKDRLKKYYQKMFRYMLGIACVNVLPTKISEEIRNAGLYQLRRMFSRQLQAACILRTTMKEIKVFTTSGASLSSLNNRRKERTLAVFYLFKEREVTEH
jgi:hypothetical protein